MSDAVLEELPGDRVRVRVSGREFVIDAACTHRLGRLVHGHVNPRTLRITCPLHSTSFDLTTGCPVAGPSAQPLTVHHTGALGQVYEPQDVWLPASERLLEWDDGFHDLMLGDRLRMTAYKAAVTEAVRPGATVLDLGTGTGILAQWALEAGAARVYGIDLNEKILETATRRLTEAGFGDRFHPLRGFSFDIELPERVDLIISEIMGNLADNENCVAILDDARTRFLRPGGAMLPAAVESYLVPVTAEAAHGRVRDGAPQDAGTPAEFAELLKGRGARDAFDLYYDAIIPVDGQLAAPRLVRRYAFEGTHGAHETSYEVPLVYTVQREGLFTGFKGYFVATLSDTVALDISGDEVSPGDPRARTTSDSWKHAYLPVRDAVPVRPGDRIALTFSRRHPADTGSGSFGQVYGWEGSVVSGDTTVARFSHSTRPDQEGQTT
ncbi:methyltransferase domain-containing protein [Streptomyces sp. H27-H1]|uniref:methyltransferase domain-containing protein n=1 Tax=Streptomyces sp. H27-H1 TaxID=2996461 RepID=UPI00226EB2CE|nr:methyltransferase domain-containing protein [Streptomyces sp. H27-H1]MCY0928946.1 methyltransferase domain-containing protein [Streptomyces sp. H27-H1]